MTQGPPADRNYWEGWARVQTQVEYLGRAVDDLKHQVPKAIEQASVRLEAGARADREHAMEARARVRTEFEQMLSAHERQYAADRKDYAEDRKEYKENTRKTTMMWTIGLVLLALLQFLPLLLRLLGGAKP